MESHSKDKPINFNYKYMDLDIKKNFTAKQWLFKNYRSIYDEYVRYNRNRKKERAKLLMRVKRDARIIEEIERQMKSEGN